MADRADKWTVLANADAGKDPSSSEIMFGTFNGKPESLWEMMQDAARKTAYFPAVPLTRFSAQTVVRFDLPVRVIREWISTSVQAVVQLERTAEGRVVREILGVSGLEGDIYRIFPIYPPSSGTSPRAVLLP